MKKLGLIGYPLSHSFSPGYFREKFLREGVKGFTYELFPLESIGLLPELLGNNPDITGLNVTIPYKSSVIPFLDFLDEEAEKIGAVNTIKVDHPDGKPRLSGFNTDIYGFRKSLEPLLAPRNTAALVLGTGGAAKAVIHVLRSLGMKYLTVSRQAGKGDLTYEQLDKDTIGNHLLVVNTTPLGMSPAVDTFPDIPYQFLTANHLLYDLVYNPAETLFMRKGKEAGAHTKNGLEMLHLQADRAWEIFSGKA